MGASLRRPASKKLARATSTLFVRINPALKDAVVAMASHEKRDQVDVVERLLTVGKVMCSRFPESLDRMERQSLQSGTSFEDLLLQWLSRAPSLVTAGDVA